MENINSPIYDDYRKNMRNMRRKHNWEFVKYAGRDNKEGLQQFIDQMIDLGTYDEFMNADLWIEIVSTLKAAEEREMNFDESKTVLISEDVDNGMTVPTDEKSSWQLYKNKLVKSGWSRDSIEEIEKTTLIVLKKLNSDTTEIGPIKGLMIGHVQSGKTANMAALMAMAADWGWNMFVVLSGVIENLRKQTEKRLHKDLNHPGNLSWFPLQNLSKKSSTGQRAQDLLLNANNRYFTVCLKHKTRLENLIDWIYSDPNKARQMKILVIDDEADQAGINTSDVTGEDRAKINSLIVELVEGKRNSKAKPQSMNYISYTATPYANFLNESSPESLYPKDFIGVLNPAKEYFGPKQIFGIHESDAEGLDIIREIPDTDLNHIHDIHDSGLQEDIPKSLRDSICWFFISVAMMRKLKYKKPISMLVHTSQKQTHHEYVARSIEKWINNTGINEIIKICQSIYDYETKTFNLENFRASYKEYGIPNSELNTYPKFKDIENNIRQVVSEISHIPLGEEGDLVYGEGLHLCIDNCANNGINDENMFVRLAYPDPESPNYPTIAPAFIVIGGSTLSRGLTIEGLVSTYFLRTSKQADTLLQMGRWFGYRKGYELFPRIWMTQDTQEKFKFLATLEEELREDLKIYLDLGERPINVGPKIKNTPNSSWLRITAKNRMQSAELTDMDFTGTSNQTVVFPKDDKKLKENIKITENLIDNIGEAEICNNNSSLLWREVDFEKIKEFLTNFNFHERARVFNQMDTFCNWYQESIDETEFTGWNVIVSGKGKVEDKEKNNGWDIGNYNIGIVNRSRRGTAKDAEESISIGVLRGPSDVFADIKDDLIKQYNIDKTNITKSYIREVREKVGLGKTPQLIIYRINKNSNGINLSEDIIGLSILVPGQAAEKNFAKKLTVKLPDNVMDFHNDESEE